MIRGGSIGATVQLAAVGVVGGIVGAVVLGAMSSEKSPALLAQQKLIEQLETIQSNIEGGMRKVDTVMNRVQSKLDFIESSYTSE